ncbi:MAG: hypothetical protein IPK60_17755 [Sandaracinaceae bacterium]|nr:hypothetical protein [Sandaracinaceae bacterium]
MSAPPVPSFFASTANVFRFQLLRIVRGRKLRFGVIAVLLVVIGTAVARFTGGAAHPEQVFETGVRTGFMHMLVYLLPFLFISGTIAEEVESRTFTFIALRPTGRFALTTGKYGAGVAVATALITAGLVLLFLCCFITTPALLGEHIKEFLRVLLACLLLVWAYGAMCMMWGALAVEAAGIVSALYLGVVEFAFSYVPLLKFISMNHYATAIAGYHDDVSEMLQRLELDVPAALCVVIIVVVTALFYGLAALVVSASEYRTSKA